MSENYAKALHATSVEVFNGKGKRLGKKEKSIWEMLSEISQEGLGEDNEHSKHWKKKARDVIEKTKDLVKEKGSSI